jgi:membrane protein involved in colicin uptake
MIQAMLRAATPRRDHGHESDRGLTMEERAKKARHAAYVLAKERKKKDPRIVELKAKLKQARREANAQAKERRKNDAAQIALEAKIKKDRQDASKLAKDQRKARASATKKAERAAKDTHMRAALGFASALLSQSGPQPSAASCPPGVEYDDRQSSGDLTRKTL